MLEFIAGIIATLAFVTIVSLLVPPEWLESEEED